MATERDNLWPAATLARGVQQAGEQAMEQQMELMRRFFDPTVAAMNPGVATFKTRVQSGGRISIPDTERDALGIQEGDIVQAMIVPLRRGRDRDE